MNSLLLNALYGHLRLTFEFSDIIKEGAPGESKGELTFNIRSHRIEQFKFKTNFLGLLVPQNNN